MYGDQFGEFSVLFSLFAVLIPYTQTPQNGSLDHKSDTLGKSVLQSVSSNK